MVTVQYPRIRRAAVLLSNGNAWEADDLAQETLLHAAQGWSRFKGASCEGTWLYSILVNQHRQRQRTGRRSWRRRLSWLNGTRATYRPPLPKRRLSPQSGNRVYGPPSPCFLILSEKRSSCAMLRD